MLSCITFFTTSIPAAARRIADLIVAAPAMLLALPFFAWAISPLSPIGVLQPIVLTGFDGRRYRTFTSSNPAVRCAMRTLDIARGRRSVLRHSHPPLLSVGWTCQEFIYDLYRQPSHVWKRYLLGNVARGVLMIVDLMGAPRAARGTAGL
jgi:hypothetical protein